MADTWTPIFDLSTPEKIRKFTKNTEKEIDSLLRAVLQCRTNRHMRPRTPAFLTRWIAQPIYDRRVRRTANLRVEDTCIGCGLCAKKCPVQAIEMQDRRPVWRKERCVMCLGCLHRFLVFQFIGMPFPSLLPSTLYHEDSSCAAYAFQCSQPNTQP